jgi:two-component system sensor histidine kinase GlrK
MKVATKLAGGFSLLIVILAALMFNHLVLINRAVSANRNLSAIAQRLTISTADQTRYLDQLDEAFRKYIYSQDERYVQVTQEAVDGFERTLDQLESSTLTEKEREGLEGLTGSWSAVARLVADPEAVSEVGGPATIEARFNAGVQAVRFDVRRVNLATQGAMSAEVMSTSEAATTAERISLLALGIAGLLAMVLSFRIVRSITRPLAGLTRATEAVADGDFSVRVTAARGDEFSRLARGFNDMTRRLSELDQMKKDLISHVSHELKTPLASMQETNQLMLDELPGELVDSQRRLLTLNLRSGRRLSAMISKLLNLSHIDAGALEYEYEDHDLCELLKRVVREFGPVARDKGHRVVTSYPEDPVWVSCDTDRIEEAVYNLLDNAAKFSPADTEILLELERCVVFPPSLPDSLRRSLGLDRSRRTADGDAFAVVSVSDSGPGVPDELRSRIFERFFQASSARAVPGKGVGLGLALTKQVVNAHGGGVWVDDQTTDPATDDPTGARFFLALPAATAPVAQQLQATGLV